MLLVRTHILAYAVLSQRLARMLMLPLSETTSHKRDKHFLQRCLLTVTRENSQSAPLSRAYGLPRGQVTLNNDLNTGHSALLIYRGREPFHARNLGQQFQSPWRWN